MAESQGFPFFAGGNSQWVMDDTTFALHPRTGAGALDVGTASLPVGALYCGALTPASVASTGAVSGTTLALTGGITTASVLAASAKGAGMTLTVNEEEVTLSTGGATTDSTTNLLPALSLILYVGARVTTTITTATDWKLGDASTADRFTAANSTMTAGTTDNSKFQWDPSKAAGYAPWQAAAAKIRIATTGTPGAGKIRLSVIALTFNAPTS